MATNTSTGTGTFGGSFGGSKSKPAPPKTIQDLVYSNYSPYPPANEWAFQAAAPHSQPVAQGYDANAPRIQGVRRAAAVNQTNARLVDGTGSSAFQMSMFVTYVGIDTALSMSTAQSQLSRDGYPHNFIQPSFIVRGWSLDQQDYGLLCEFIHRAQHKSVASNTPTQLHVFGRHTLGKGLQRGYDGKRRDGGKVTLSRPGILMPDYKSDPPGAPEGTFVNQLLRGAHQEVLCQGYVLAMPRQHHQYQGAVAWQFSFTITTMLKGIYAEPAGITVSQGKTWADILADSKKLGVVSVSAKENAAALAFAAQHAATIFDATQPTSSGGGTPSGGGSTPSSGWTHGLVTEAILVSTGTPHGWSGQEITDWEQLIVSESNGTLTDTNPGSGAYGIAQFIKGPPEYYTYGGDPNTLQGQITAMANYIAQRYGNPSVAWAFHLAHNYY